MISSETYKKEESNQLSDNSSKNSNLKTLLTFCIKTKYLENNLLIDEYFEKDLEIIQNKSIWHILIHYLKSLYNKNELNP